MEVFEVKAKRKVLVTILMIWMIVIFGFSNQNVVSSLSLSDKIASKMIDIVVKVRRKEISPLEKVNMVKKMRVTVRKTAHFTEYFILGVLIFKIFEMYGVSNILLYATLFCFLYACSDEIHQLFSDGRTAKFLDVLIDTSGSVLSIGYLYFLKQKNFNKTKELSQND